jgi:transglutaminase-like putative cysteine protease
MNHDRFDRLTRFLAEPDQLRLDRRTLLRLLGLGGAALTVPANTRSVDAAQDSLSPATGVPTIAQQAADLFYDPEAIFRFVRDEIQYDPYAGAMRGARGTLWGLAGNSVDQAMLLAALLNEALVETRFVVGELSEEAGTRLLASLRLDEAAVRARADRVFVASPEEVTEPPTLTADEETSLARLTKAQDRFDEIADRQLASGIETILTGLASAGIDLSAPDVELPDLERRHHVWVQYADGGSWIDLDPSLSGSEPGTAHAMEMTTFDQLPDDIYHRITFKLVAEKVSGGVLAREDLLTFAATSADLAGIPITLMHPNADALKAAGVAIQEAITGLRTFIPSLIVGSQSHVGRPVTFVTGDGALGTFGDGAADGDTLGEWLEISLTTPNETRTIVRELFDRVSIARRGDTAIDLTTIPRVELVATGDAAPNFPPLANAWSIGVISGAIPRGYFDEESQDPLVALSRAVHVYHHIRDALAFGNSHVNGYRFVIDEPNLTAVIQTPSTSADSGQASTLRMDLLHRHQIALPIDGNTPTAQPLVAAGVFGHAIERALMETAGTDLLGLPDEDFISVGRVFEEAKQQGIPTVILRPGVDDTSRLTLDEVAQLRIAAALAAGYVVIVPERAVELGGAMRSGWWLVDPATGTTLDQLDDGGGATMIDYAFTVLRIMVCAAAAIHALGLVSLIKTYGAGNELQARWIGRRAAKTALLAGACIGMGAI